MRFAREACGHQQTSGEQEASARQSQKPPTVRDTRGRTSDGAVGRHFMRVAALPGRRRIEVDLLGGPDAFTFRPPEQVFIGEADRRWRAGWAAVPIDPIDFAGAHTETTNEPAFRDVRFGRPTGGIADHAVGLSHTARCTNGSMDGLEPSTQRFDVIGERKEPIRATLGRWPGNAFDRSGPRGNPSSNRGGRDLCQVGCGHRVLDEVNPTSVDGRPGAVGRLGPWSLLPLGGGPGLAMEQPAAGRLTRSGCLAAYATAIAGSSSHQCFERTLVASCSTCDSQVAARTSGAPPPYAPTASLSRREWCKIGYLGAAARTSVDDTVPVTSRRQRMGDRPPRAPFGRRRTGDNNSCRGLSIILVQ